MVRYVAQLCMIVFELLPAFVHKPKLQVTAFLTNSASLTLSCYYAAADGAPSNVVASSAAGTPGQIRTRRAVPVENG